MKIVEIVETLIQMQNERKLTQREHDAVRDACDILDKLPRIMDERTAQEAVLQLVNGDENIKAALQDADTTLLKLYGCGGLYCDGEIEAYQQRKKAREPAWSNG